MKKERTILQKKNKIKPQEKNLNEMNISNLLDKEFKVMVIKMLTELRRKMDENGENFNEETEDIRKFQIEVTELENAITELRNTVDEAKERIGELKDRSEELIQSENKEEKRMKIMNIA